MVVLSAFVCSVFIAYERCPELRFAMQVEQDILACNSGHMPICSGMDSGLLAGALTY